ncbi:hypothetical protein [Asanoa sp. NPDC050611]|uniref:hypothetical protein n=1 Tax=Asanoa sp. NPDC050611 TaxID=3157098 RepID=UPI0033E20D13
MPLSRRTALLALPLLLTACSGRAPEAAPPAAAPTSAAPSPSPSPIDPRPRLAIAARDLAKTSYKIVQVDGDDKSVWQVHGPSRSLRVTPSGAPGGTIQIGPDRWITGVLEGGVLSGRNRWIKLPRSAGAPMPDVVAARLVAAATGLTETAPGTFTGTVPEQVCRDVLLFGVDAAQVVLAEPSPETVRWAATGTITVKLDGRGRFAGLAVSVRSADGRTTKRVAQTYSDYGKVGRPTKPPAKDVLDLPAFPK